MYVFVCTISVKSRKELIKRRNSFQLFPRTRLRITIATYLDWGLQWYSFSEEIHCKCRCLNQTPSYYLKTSWRQEETIKTFLNLKTPTFTEVATTQQGYSSLRSRKICWKLQLQETLSRFSRFHTDPSLPKVLFLSHSSYSLCSCGDQLCHKSLK